MSEILSSKTLVQRLRETCAGNMYTSDCEIGLEAAAEIERLQAYISQRKWERAADSAADETSALPIRRHGPYFAIRKSNSDDTLRTNDAGDPLISHTMDKTMGPYNPKKEGHLVVLVMIEEMSPTVKANACPKSDDGLHRPNMFSSPLNCSECNALLRAAR